MCTIRIWLPEGDGPETDRIEMSSAATHYNAGDHLADEAALLMDFNRADGIPDHIGDWHKVEEGCALRRPDHAQQTAWVDYQQD
jgi:hypothetical protein